jgi:hypothetical protein
MTTTTASRAPARKTITTKKAIVKVDITKLNNKQLEALDEEVFISSLSPWLRKLMTAAQPFKGKLK